MIVSRKDTDHMADVRRIVEAGRPEPPNPMWGLLGDEKYLVLSTSNERTQYDTVVHGNRSMQHSSQRWSVDGQLLPYNESVRFNSAFYDACSSGYRYGADFVPRIKRIVMFREYGVIDFEDARVVEILKIENPGKKSPETSMLINALYGHYMESGKEARAMQMLEVYKPAPSRKKRVA